MLTEPEFYLMTNSIHVDVQERRDGRCNVVITGEALVDGKSKKFIIFRSPKVRDEEYYAKQGNLKMLWFDAISKFEGLEESKEGGAK